MLDLPGLKARIRQAAALRESGQHSEAGKILDALVLDSSIEVLEQQTALGMPRQLHSALLKLAKAEKDDLRRIGYQYFLVPPPDTLKKFVRFSSSERRLITQANRKAIPRQIHQVWIGSLPVPQGCQAWRQHARSHGYDYRLWREADMQEIGLAADPLYGQLVAAGDLPGAVDVARYTILERLGGIYLDCDWYPTRNDISFHDLLPMTGLTAMAEEIPRNTGKGGLLLANGMLLAPAEHPVLTRLCKVLSEVVEELGEAPAWWATGPLIFTLLSRGGSVTLADAEFIAGSLPQETPLTEVNRWCRQAQQDDLGLLLLWKSWIW